jgi:hypothetical protein
LKKKIERTKKNLELKAKIFLKIKLTNESKTKKIKENQFPTNPMITNEILKK